MAFVKEFTTRYECKICGEKVKEHWTGIPLYIRYKHPGSSMYEVNGYPMACKNNGKIIESYEVQKVNCPIIYSDQQTMSY